MNPLKSQSQSQSATATDPTEPTEDTQTRPSHRGSVPLPVAVTLLIFLSGVVPILATQSGVSASGVGIAIGAGIIAGGGVRVAESVPVTGLRGSSSTLIIWMSSLMFLLAGAIAAGHSSGGTQAVGVAVTAVTIAYLIAYGIVGATGHPESRGGGKKVISSHIIGTGVLMILVICLAIGGQFVGALDSTIGFISSIEFSTLGVPDNDLARLWINCGLIFITTIGIQRLILRVPIEVFMSVGNVSHVSTIRHRAQKLQTPILIALSVTLGAGTILSLIPNSTPPIEMIVTAIGSLSSPLLTDIFAGSVALLAVVYTGEQLTVRLSRANPEVVLRHLSPPVAIIGTTYAALIAFQDQITEFTTASTVERGGELTVQQAGQAIQSIYNGNPESPLILMLILIVMALLGTTVVLMIPTVVVKPLSGRQRGPTVGIASAASGVALLTVMSTINGTHPGVVIGGVISAVIVWEFGEYSLVAARELSIGTPTQESDQELHTGIGRLLTVHAAVVVILGCVGGGLAAGALVGVSGVTIPQGVAVLTVTFATIALTGIIQVIFG